MISLVALPCRTSDRSAGGARGALTLGAALAERFGAELRTIGTPGEPREGAWDADLRDSRGCLLEAGGQVDDALAGGSFPVALAGDCSICVTTLPAVLRHVPDVRVLWLDAHPDFNTPDTTSSAFLGGMCLAAACGRWEAGLADEVLDPARLTLCGVRHVDPGEYAELELAGVPNVARPSGVPDRLRDASVYLHLDLDVLDPLIFPAQFPADFGMSFAALRTLLAEVGRAATFVGVEITAFEAPEDPGVAARLAGLVAEAIEPLIVTR